jgi:hypothetical protein
MRVDKLDTDKGIRAIELCQEVSDEVLAKWCKENDVEDRDALILSILDHLCFLNQEDPRVDNQTWPEYSYGDVAQLQGLASHERLNILPDGKDEHEEWDELFYDEPTWNSGPLDKPTLVKILSLQASMEQALIDVSTYTNPVFETRHKQRAALDRRMKAYKKNGDGGPEHYELTKKMMAANTRARNAAMAAGREDAHPRVVEAWESFNHHKELMEKEMGQNKQRYYSFVTNVAPFIPTNLSTDSKLTWKKKRIKWLMDAIDEVEAELAIEEEHGLNPNYIYRDDDKSRVYDDAWARDDSLNRGEDLAWDYLKEREEQEETKLLKLYYKPKEISKGDQAYNEWLTKKYQTWWAATQRLSSPSGRR